MKRYPNKEFHEFYKKEHPETSLSISDINKIIATFIKLAQKEIINKRDGFEISGLGHMIVISRPVTDDSKILDLKKSYINDKAYEQLNLHSAGRLCKIIFSSKSRKYKIKNKRLWTFKFVQSFRNKISKAFRKNYTKYLRVYKFGGIAKRLMDY